METSLSDGRQLPAGLLRVGVEDRRPSGIGLCTKSGLGKSPEVGDVISSGSGSVEECWRFPSPQVETAGDRVRKYGGFGSI
jgi:hypothetical protein